MLSGKEFLKSAQGKMINNKRKAEPDMRVEALLGSTCKRLRREIKSQNPEKAVQSIKGSQSIDTDHVSDLSFLKANSYSTFTDYDSNCSDNFVGLLDDPKQVEIFLRQVENQCQTDTSKDRSFETTDFFTPFYDVYDISDKTGFVPEPMRSGSSDVDMFCTNFESLYEELLDSLASVEKWMNLAAADNAKLEYNQGYLSEDQNEVMIELSSLTDVKS